ncbi:MAG TPA: hypothetical protein VE954_31165 [Oligoflexus sp.]|uniref:hypothetical protein n=1 Tax=Oligoflexus sp. TaxID=1971216 RepID=UPI002D2CC76C|nr:hypothetical protein [Oligoflexus sp.]HYX37584.1 hypothetical protein [Oligoflexus sp.]
MRFTPVIFFALAASNAYANSPAITIGVGRSDLSSKFSIDGEERTIKNKLQTAYLGVFIPSASETFGLGAEVGAGVSNGTKNFSTRSFKFVPNYKVLDLGVWVFAGAGYYDIRDTGVNHNVTTGLLGTSFRPKTGIDRLNMDFSILFEKSISSEDFKINGVKVSNYKLENLGTSLGFAYSL